MNHQLPNCCPDKGILQLLPQKYREMLCLLDEREKYITEVRFRVDRPILIMEGMHEYVVDDSGNYIECTDKCFGDAQRMGRDLCYLTSEDIQNLLEHFCKYSIYAYQEELRQGYITLEGGHRLGIAGQIVPGEQGIRTMKHISSMNLRIAHEIPDAADEILPYVYDEGAFHNTLIISPPGCGKTTMLRDLIRQISEGNPYDRGRTVGVVDERSEIGACYLGVPQNDLGPRTDILDACPKEEGMMMLLRSMNPQVIAIDELGSREQIQALQTAASCGVNIIATIHGNSLEDIQDKEGLEEFLKKGGFRCLIFLKKTLEPGHRVNRVYLYAKDHYSQVISETAADHHYNRISEAAADHHYNRMSEATADHHPPLKAEGVSTTYIQISSAAEGGALLCYE